MSERDENGINTVKNDKYKSLPISLEKAIFFYDLHQTFNFTSRFLSYKVTIKSLVYIILWPYASLCSVFLQGLRPCPEIDVGVKDINHFQPDNESDSLSILGSSSCVARPIDGSKVISEHPWTANKTQASVSLFVGTF